MYECIKNLFIGFLVDDPLVLGLINAYGGKLYIEEGVLVFSLTDLHKFLLQSCDESMDYQAFQNLLYQSFLNQVLKEHGGQLVVHHSTGKVVTNLYRLERIAIADSSG